MKTDLPKKKINIAFQLAGIQLQPGQEIAPREAGVIYEMQTLIWIYRWGFSTSKVIESCLLNRSSGGYLNKLAKKGLLTKTYIKHSQIKHFFTLSMDGLSQVERCAETLLNYIEINPRRVNRSQIIHSLTSQELTIQALKNGEISQFHTEREFRNYMLSKIPDCIWHVGVDRIGIELELTQKHNHKLDSFILKILDTLENLDQNPFSIQKFRIYTDSLAIKKNYQTKFSPGSRYYIRSQNDRGRWVIVRPDFIPEWTSTLISFHSIELDGKN